MRIWKTIMITFLLGVVGISSFGCGSESDSASVLEMQVVTVQRGNLVIDIAAVGNLALSRTDDLAFEIAGTVEEVLVEEGDTVEEGQLLAKLDTSEWEDSLAVLEDKVTAAERNLTSDERDLTEAEHQVTAKERDVTEAEYQVTAKERDVTEAERQVTRKELAVRQAQLDLETAEDNLYKTTEVKWEKAAVDAAEFQLRVAQVVNDWQMVLYWQERLAQAEADLQEALNGSSVTASSDVALEFAESQLAVEQKEVALEDAQIAVEDAKLDVDEARLDKEYAEQDVKDAKLDVEEAKLDVEEAKLDVEEAKQDVEDAQSALDEAKSLSPIIVAPFAGFITTVNVEGGDEVLKGTVAVQLADPNEFEADVMVSEMDIFQVKLGGDASVQLDAMPTVVLPAKVTHIAPTATIQSGVVNYVVKVEIQSLETVQQERQAARPGMTEDISSGQLPERLRQAIEEGSITQEQAEAMMKGWQQAAEDISSGQLPEFLQQAVEEGRITQEQAEGMVRQWQQGQEGQTGEPQRQTPAMLTEDFQLREGLTVTVSILVHERNDVLLVPNGMLIHRGSETLVQVLEGDVVEERVIKTGLSDWQYTEVTEGLSEGEEVVAPQTATPSEASTQGRPGGMFR